ncbi:unnamed protein product [Mytilus coruscus]|uniref:Uncharacterized protein n=1 Tax=Mytilus coruscus TaxID=42192 RepID=A0A6J8BQF5_MYTCO|nr:unnamed protein product [Mytilus coruscus]
MATATPEQARHGRISIVVADILAEMLQDIIAHAQMPPKALYDRIVQTKDFNKKLSPEEWQVVNKLANPHKGFKVLDVSLAYRIVKHFRNTFVTKPTRNWGSNPTPTEVEIGDDVERIRRARNRYLHGLSINITEKTMSDFFKEFTEVAKRIDQYLNKTLESSFEKKLENFRTCSINENKTRETLKATSVVENQEDDADKSPFVLIFPEIQDEDAEEKAKLLNDFKDKINKGQLKFVFDRGTEGSLLSYVEVIKSLLEQDSSFLIEISTFMDRISELIDLGPDEIIHVIITQPDDELCDIETDSDSENDMSEEEQHIDHHALAVYFRLKKETLTSEENFQEGMKEFIETIVTIANGKHLTEKHEIDVIVEPGIESATMSRPSAFEYSEEKQLTLPEFHRKYKDNLPLLVIVTKGFHGETMYDDYANGQIIRLNRACQQLRALARLSRDAGSIRDEFLSIPVYGKYKFAVVKSSKKVGNPQLMEEILAENNLPVQVRYASYNKELRSTLQSIKGVNILVMKTYVEDNIQGNYLEDGVISPITALVALCPDISVSIITGYTHKSEEQFQAKLRSMNFFVQKYIKFQDNEGSPELTKFERGAKTTGTGNAVPPDLLPCDYTQGGDCNDVPLIPRQNSKSAGYEKDDIYEPLPEPDTKWLPPRPQKHSAEKRLPLPARPFDSISAVVEDQNYRVINADESLNLESSDNYMYISETFSSDSDYYSSTSSSSVGSSNSFVNEKSLQEILGILKTLNLSKYCKEFADRLVDGAVLQELNEEILRKDFNFMHVEAIRLMKYVSSGHIPK